MMVTIRLAEISYLEILLPMIQALSAHHGDDTTPDEAGLRRDLWGDAALGTALLAMVGDRAVGYAIVGDFPRFHAGLRGSELHHIYVAPEARGSGAGRALMAAAEAQARARGHDRLLLSAGTEPVQAFYRSLGYEQLADPNPRFRKMLG